MRRTVRRQNVGVALFPFLAVLICTMGSLIVLLVLLVQQARVDARSIAAAHSDPVATPEDAKRHQQELEDAQWRRELLEQSRTEKAQELAEARAKLAHLEDHIQRLSVSAQELLDRARRIDEGKQLREDQLAAAQAEFQRMQAEIVRKQAELDHVRRQLQSQEKWYALIPYEGPHGTRRRPIYIECTAEGIILQPEGLVLVPGDFDGPLGPGNPLDAALRTIREYISQTTGGKVGEPYPLLIVRPSGIHAYGAARAALKSWDDEFGYELVADERKLVFGSPDPALAATLEKSVAIARQRQAMMASMMPRHYHDAEPPKSFAPDYEPAAESSAAKSPTGRTIGGAAGARGAGPAAGGLSDSAGERSFAGAGRGSASGQGGSSMAAGTPAQGLGPYGSGLNDVASTGNGANPAAGAAAPGTSAGGSPGGSAASGQMSGQMGSPGSGSAMNPAASGASVSIPAGQRGKPSGGSGSPSAGSSGQARGGKVASGAGRGSNWGLPGAGRHATAITRPIHVAVLLDRFVLVPERGDDRPPQHLRVSDELTPAQVDAFVSAVQREMKSWGLAVENGYWKPVLQMEVAPDSEHHFADLQTALEGSGFEIQRKQP